jgi:hypothetical protein
VRALLELLQLLGAPPLSSCVSADVSYEELASWDEMAQRIADALLMAQRWCWHSMSRQQYDAIAGRWSSHTEAGGMRLGCVMQDGGLAVGCHELVWPLARAMLQSGCCTSWTS